MTTPDLAMMLRELAERGWKPLLYAETHVTEHRQVLGWVCYPMGEVRAWTSVRAADPLGAVRGLWCWAQDHPNEPPAGCSREDASASPHTDPSHDREPAAATEEEPIAYSVCRRPTSPFTGLALAELIRAAARFLRAAHRGEAA